MVGFEQPVAKYVKPQKTTSGDFDFTEVDDMLSRDYVQGSIIQMVRNITPVGTSAQQVIPTDGTDILAINTDGSINSNTFSEYLARNGTLKIFEDNGIAATTTTLYTVPAGKTLYVVHAAISGTINSGFGAAATVDLKTDQTGAAATILALHLKNGTSGDQHGDTTLSAIAPIKINTTKTLTLVKTTHYIQKTVVVAYEI